MEMDILNVFKALKLAYRVHKYQKDRGFHRYIYHPIRVARNVYRMYMDNDSNKYFKYPLYYYLCVALLHDTVEDSTDRTNTLKYIHANFNKIICNGVMALTHDKNKDTYTEYVHNIGNYSNNIPIIVKLCDLTDNMNLDRLYYITPNDVKRFNKYRKCYDYLLNRLKYRYENE